MTFLQNHIGDPQFPGDKHFNPTWAQQRINPRTKAVTTWVVFGTTFCALVVAMCLANLGGTPERGRAGLLTFIAVVAAVGLLLGIWSWRRWDAARSGLWRAQQDYNRAVGRQAPTAEQLQALQLGTAWDFRDKSWGHSLAKFPCEREVGHLPDWRQRFAMIDPGTVADHRAALMEWWAIGTTASYREMVARLFNGLHSRNLDAAYLGTPTLGPSWITSPGSPTCRSTTSNTASTGRCGIVACAHRHGCGAGIWAASRSSPGVPTAPA